MMARLSHTVTSPSISTGHLPVGPRASIRLLLSGWYIAIVSSWNGISSARMSIHGLSDHDEYSLLATTRSMGYSRIGDGTALECSGDDKWRIS